MTVNIVLVGARSVRQGTGPFLAAALTRPGARITGIVGTRTDTVRQAQRELQAQCGIDVDAYTDLAAAIAVERPQAVVICSPWHVHAEQLAIVAAGGCHCLVEKPLAWPVSEQETDRLVSAFESRGLLLQVVSQWPHTLPAFETLHGPVSRPVTHFAMRLSPISLGATMIPDSAPHLLGMLQALNGPGDCTDISVQPGSLNEAGELDSLMIHCQYRHAAGHTDVMLRLRTCPERPRPAWYEIDGLRVEREVVLPEYQQFLVAGERRVALTDPLQGVADAFITALAHAKLTEGDALRAAQRNLEQLTLACSAALVQYPCKT